MKTQGTFSRVGKRVISFPQAPEQCAFFYLGAIMPQTEEQKEYQKKYREDNKEKQKKYQQEYYQKNKEKRDEVNRKWHEENKERSTEFHKKWNAKNFKKYPYLSAYHNAKQRCTNTKHPFYKSYGKRGIKFLMTKKDFEHLWYRDNADLMDCASIDRKNNDRHYELSNCQFIEMDLNRKKGNKGV